MPVEDRHKAHPYIGFHSTVHIGHKSLKFLLIHAIK